MISTTEELEQLCTQARTTPVVMLDTEFVRTRTYHPQLGLIQLYDGSQLALIDPLTIEDMSSFKLLLEDEAVLKVLHACGEDLEVFQHTFDCVPTPMLDTQLMAAFLGNGLSTGFAKLASEHLGIELDKSESRANWLARPLTEKQHEYAAADVYYLMPIYEKLLEGVEQAGWLEAVKQETDLLISKRLQVTLPEDAYQNVKGTWILNPEQLAILKVVAKWRLEEAQSRDMALNFIVKESDMLELCRQQMTSLSQMNEAGFDYREVRRHGNKLLALVKEGMAIPEDQWPAKVTRLVDSANYKQMMKTLKDAVKEVAETSGLATEFLASKKQLEQLIRWAWELESDPESLPDLMRDWRLPLLGEKLHILAKQ